MPQIAPGIDSDMGYAALGVLFPMIVRFIHFAKLKAHQTDKEPLPAPFQNLNWTWIFILTGSQLLLALLLAFVWCFTPTEAIAIGYAGPDAAARLFGGIPGGADSSPNTPEASLPSGVLVESQATSPSPSSPSTIEKAWNAARDYGRL